jgi:hypothetical protein
MVERNNPLLEAALRYAELGYKVFPLVPGKKHPLTAHGLLDATDDENRIEEWWSQTPEANIGLRTDGLLVLDVDGPENAFLFDGSADAAVRLESLSGTPMQRTPRRGFHFVFREPAGRHWRNTYGALAHHVDTRTNGGYIVVAPSRLDGSRVYAWVEAHGLDVPPAALSEPPDWLTSALDTCGTGAPAISPPGEEPEKIPEGRRDCTLTSLAGHMRRVGLSSEEFARALLEINRRRCVPPLSEKRVLKIAQSVGRYEPDQMASALAAGGVWMNAEPAEDEVPHPGVFPEDLLEVPGLIGEICRWNLETARAPQPILAIAGAIALVSTLIGRKLQDETGTQSNLYVVGLAPAGAGKDHARRVNKLILEHSGWDELIGPEDIGSHAGILSAIDLQRVLLFQVDELGRLLKTLRSPERSPHLYQIVSVLLRLFSSSGTLFVGPAYADVKKVKKIQWPHACLYGTTVPDSFYEALSKESLQDGFVARLLVFDSPAFRDSPRPGRTLPVPGPILKQVIEWKSYNPSGGNLNGAVPHPTSVVLSAGATLVFDSLGELCRKESEANRLGVGSIWLRVLEKAKKLALVYAASQFGLDVREISPEAARWGARLSEYTTRAISSTSQANVTEGQYESDLKKVLRRVQKAGEAGISKTGVLRAFPRIRASMLDELLMRLREEGRIGIQERRTDAPGRPATVFVDGCLRRLL